MQSGQKEGVSGPALPAVHVLIPTHTSRHLALCLAALGRQSLAPRSITISCDGDRTVLASMLESIIPLVTDGLYARTGHSPLILHTHRPHQGEPRLNQVRNNGLRALRTVAMPADGDLIVVIDGDMALAPNAIERHAEFARQGADVVVPFRINLTEQATARLDVQTLLPQSAGAAPLPPELEPSPSERQTLAARARRYRRQLLVRRLMPLLVKAHKPKLLGGHHALRWNAIVDVNGYDEAYIGYGYDDDDLARRLHQRGRLRWRIAVEEIIAHHLWHPTRAPADPTCAPGYARFATPGLPFRAARGVDQPAAQPSPEIEVLARPRTDA